MQLSPHLVVTAPAPIEELLGNWRWLVPQHAKLKVATALGDLFLLLDGAVSWLDVGTGELTRVATSKASFEAELQDAEQFSLWFGPSLVEACETYGLRRKPSECFSYLQLPMLGGVYEPANFKVRSLERHLAGWGPICERLAPIPDGTTLELDVRE